MKRDRLKNQLLLSTTLATSLFGYCRKAYSSCVSNGVNSYLCSGSNSGTQTIHSDNANVTTSNGFSVTTNSGNAIEISGYGDLSFSDQSDSVITLTGSNPGKALDSNGIYVYALPYLGNNSSINITSNSTINAHGDNISDLSMGIYSRNYAYGDSTIEVNGTINANRYGVKAYSYDGNDLNVTTGINSKIDLSHSSSSPNAIGLYAINYLGNGDTNLNIDGDIYSNSMGIYAYANGSSENLSINIGSESRIETNSTSLKVRNAGIGSTNIEINGDLISETSSGASIVNRNNGDSTISVNSQASIEGKGIGVLVLDVLSSDNHLKTINIDGRITSLENAGLSFLTTSSNNNTATSEINTGENSLIQGATDGIRFTNLTSGISNLNINGDITATTGDALNIFAANGGANINLANGATISGNKAINLSNANSASHNITLNGSNAEISVTGTSGTAIEFGSQNDDLDIIGNVAINGNIDAKDGTDSLTLNNTNLTLANSSSFQNFENLNLIGSNILNGSFDFADFDLIQDNGGSLTINGNVDANSLSISSGSMVTGNASLGGDLVLNSGGYISPGRSIGTINADNDVTFNNGSNFNAEIAAIGSDLLAVAGNVTINPGTNLNLSTLDSTSGSGVILTANSINGSFDNLNNSGNNIFTIHQTNNSITLVSLNPNKVTPQFQSVNANSILFNDGLNDQIANAAFSKNTNFWIKGLKRNILSNQNSTEFGNIIDGTAIGAQKELNDKVKLGFSLAQLQNNKESGDFANRASSDSSFASIYAIYNQDLNKRAKFFTSLSLGFGYHNNNNSRQVFNSGNSTNARSNSQNLEYNASLQIGAKLKLKNDYFIMPRASSSYIYNISGSFDETSGGNSAIRINKSNFETLKFRESIRFGKDNAANFSLFNNSVNLSPYIELGLAQERTLGNQKINGQFIINNAGFSTALDKNNRNFVISSFGLNAKINENITAFINYENAKDSNEDRKDLKGGLSIKF